MNYLKLTFIVLVSFVVFIGDINTGQAGGRGRRYCGDPASVEGPRAKRPREDCQGESKSKPFPLTPKQEKKIAKMTLLTVFEKEKIQYTALNDFLQDESKKPFQQALVDLRAGRHVERFAQIAPIGRRQALTSWIQQEKDTYIKNTGLAEIMKQEDRVIAAKTYKLTIEKPYSGKIVSEDKKIDCGINTCSAEYREDEKVTLTAIPDSENTKMTGWWGVCSGTELKCTVAMSKNQTVGAGFFYYAPKPKPVVSATFKLTIEKPYSGKIISKDEKINCGISRCYAEYKDGEKVTLTAIPDSENTKMTGWWGDCTGQDLKCSFTMDANKQVGAGFFYEKSARSRDERNVGGIAGGVNEGPKPTIPERGKEPQSSDNKGIEPAIPEKQREPANSKEDGGEKQICNPSIPKYQQLGCVEESGQQQKRSPYDGLPCPGEEVPNYSKVGCIP